MKRITQSVILLFLALFMLAGCYNKPVQHLASDAALIKAGKTSRQDVLLLLGEPKTQQVVAEGVEEWVYYEEDLTMMQRTPFVGNLFDADGYGMIRLLLKGELVTACRYSSYTTDEFDWSDDYSWQEEAEE